LFDNAQDYWFNVNGRRLICVVKAVGGSITAYMSMYAGLMNPFGTATESPYPLYISATTGIANTPPDAATTSVTGITELTAFAAAARNSSAFFRDANLGLYVRVGNSTGTAAANLNATYDTAGTSGITSGRSCLYPIGSPHADTSGSNNVANVVTNCRVVFGNDDSTFARALATLSEDELGPPGAVLYPTIGDNEMLLVPCVVSVTDNTTPGSNHSIRGELDSVYWIPGTTSAGASVASEDTVTISSTRYKIFANAHRTQRYCFFAIKEV
jgi:hypothetical protein